MNIVGNPLNNGVISRSELTFIDQFVLDEARYCLPYLDHCYASNLPNAIEMEHNALLFSRQQSANFIFNDDMAVAAAFVDVEQDEFEKNKRNRSNFNQWNHADGHKQDRYDDRTKDSVAGNMLETFSELLLREKNRVDKENIKHKKSLTTPIFNDVSKRKSNFSNSNEDVAPKRNKTVSHFDNSLNKSDFRDERPIRKKKSGQIKDEYEGSVTRCVCGMSHDDGFMISCDRCGVWQHVDCMALDKDKIPDSFLCELCSPRYVDKRRAIRIQTRKREELENPTMITEKADISRMFGVKSSGSKKMAKPHKRSISFSDDDDDEFLNYDDEDNDFIYYGKSKQSTSSSASRSKKPVSNRKNGKLKVNFFPTRSGGSSLKRLNLASSLKRGNKTTIASKLSNKTRTAGNKLIVNKAEPDASKQHLTFKQMQRRLRVKVADVSPDTKGVMIQEAVRSPDLPIAEFIGRFYIKADFEKSPNYDLSFRHVICSTNEDGIEICVDGRMSDSAIKHIRCSCVSNCKIVTVKDDTGRDRIFICSSTQIPEGKEITVPFYFDYQKCNEEILCPCKRASCVIGRYFRSRNSSRPIRMGSNEKSQEGILALMSEARLRLDRNKKKSRPDKNITIDHSVGQKDEGEVVAIPLSKLSADFSDNKDEDVGLAPLVIAETRARTRSRKR